MSLDYIYRPRFAHYGKGRCCFCGFGSNSQYHKTKCEATRPVTDEERRAMAALLDALVGRNQR